MTPQPTIPLKYYQPAQVVAQGTPSGNDYAFVPKNGISLAFVREQDAADLLRRKTCDCGGQKKRLKYERASDEDVARWTNGHS